MGRLRSKSQVAEAGLCQDGHCKLNGSLDDQDGEDVGENIAADDPSIASSDGLRGGDIISSPDGEGGGPRQSCEDGDIEDSYGHHAVDQSRAKDGGDEDGTEHGWKPIKHIRDPVSYTHLTLPTNREV